MRLIPIDRSGTPVEPFATLPEAAHTVCAATVALYEAVGFVPPWIGYLGVVDGQVVGTCAFKAPVSASRVEIAYFTFPEFEGRGFATYMAQELLGLARGAAPGVLVVAQTLPEENASTTILRRLGFRLAGPVQHPEDGLVWEWQFQTHAAPHGKLYYLLGRTAVLVPEGEAALPGIADGVYLRLALDASCDHIRLQAHALAHFTYAQVTVDDPRRSAAFASTLLALAWPHGGVIAASEPALLTALWNRDPCETLRLCYRLPAGSKPSRIPCPYHGVELTAQTARHPDIAAVHSQGKEVYVTLGTAARGRRRPSLQWLNHEAVDAVLVPSASDIGSSAD